MYSPFRKEVLSRGSYHAVGVGGSYLLSTFPRLLRLTISALFVLMPGVLASITIGKRPNTDADAEPFSTGVDEPTFPHTGTIIHPWPSVENNTSDVCLSSGHGVIEPCVVRNLTPNDVSSKRHASAFYTLWQPRSRQPKQFWNFHRIQAEA
jgi:hypothetical protein